MKIFPRVRRRPSGSFQAYVQTIGGHVLFMCDHDHLYGTSNRVKQDAASKCAWDAVRELRESNVGST